MYAPGHVGIGLMLWAPVGSWLVASNEPSLAVLGAALAAGLSVLPDIDERTTMAHRGPTHSIVFVAVVTLAVGFAGWSIGPVVGETPARAGLVAGVASFLALTSHVAADSITPMGIRPLWPLSDWHITFDLVPSRNPLVNWVCFTGGMIAIAGVIALTSVVG